MNPRQRRGVVLLVATSILAVGVFAGVFYYVSTVSSQVGPMTTVLQLNRSVEALEPIERTMLDEVEVPRRWVPETALHRSQEAEGLVAATDYEQGSVIQTGMLVPRPGLQPGYREVAIVVDAETGVAGKVRPGDHVDIIATTGGSEGSAPVSRVWVENVLILEVGLPQTLEDPENLATTQGLPVTFALTAQDALTVAYVESFSVKMRLALRGAGDEAELPAPGRVFNGTIPQGQG